MTRLAGARQAARRRLAAIPRRELWLVAAAMAVSFAIVAVYVLATRDQGLAGDELLYNEYGENWRRGMLWWASVPFGIEHASAWKAPAYPAWVGSLYTMLGASAFRVEMVQALLAPLGVALTWMIGRRLFDPVVAIAGAWIVAIFPLVFEYYGMLFPEALAIPLTLLVVLIAIRYPRPEPRQAAVIGALIGVLLLVRPTSFFLFAGLAVAWALALGVRRGAVLSAVAIGIAVLVVSPWTIRNAIVTDGGFIPLSVQDGAAYGTFNDEAANDDDHRWAWRPFLEDPPEILTRMPRPDDAELRRGMQDAALDYIADHPASVPKAFFWNGIVRLWDLRPPDDALDEVEFQGRSETVRAIGLAMYWAILPLAAIGLWRLRHRKELFWAAIATAVVFSLTFIVIGGTRYRAPVEPFLVLLAASNLSALSGALRSRASGRESPV